MSEISNAIIALTGGGSGLGLGLARYFARQGAQLAIFEIAPQKIQSLRCEFGDDVLVHAGDIRDAVALQSFHDAVIAKFGAVDALVGVQGIWDGNRPLCRSGNRCRASSFR
jgi:NADP-dependent 3-hydroxy acid dehydrogenase YdfG